MRFVLMLALAAGTAVADTKPEIRELARKALAGFNKEDQRVDDYGYVRRWRRTEFNSDGSIRNKEEGAWRRGIEEGYWVGRVFERQGRPIPADEKARQDEAVRKYLAERKSMTDEEWKKRQAANRKKNDQDEWIQEFPEALDFKVVGEEAIDGRPALILTCEPRAGYSPKSMRSRIFEKMRGKLWIDKADSEMVRAEAEMFDTVSLGFGVLGKIEKGTRFRLERRKLEGKFWLMTEQAMKFDARVMMVKSFKQENYSARSEFKHKSELVTRTANR